MSIATPEAVHRFWFGELSTAGLASTRARKHWFTPSDVFDARIAAEFADTVIAAENQKLDAWRTTPMSWVSYLVVCDQLPRNLWRGSARAFSLDEQARHAARLGLAAGLHQSLGPDEQSFCYMPFMHSEDILDQYLSVGLFASLRDRATGTARSYAGNSLRHAQQHRDTILQFGRFPHRNTALGRPSTPAERDAL